MALHLYEFLFRGRPEGSDEPPAYHVILADTGTDTFGRAITTLSPALTPEQAKAHGFDLPEILSSIDAGLLVENAALREQVAKLQAALDAAPTPTPTQE